ncbi:hypothetical protein V1286_006091 [Bradyrhizobium algeriense]|uniref:Uncharacterized protein n=1 Tax=Bradyrhizobium algeriense TaxID=634784 RepID=A0ABU8BKD0_9BRAD
MGDDFDSTGRSADSALTFDDDPADFDPASWGSADSDRLAVAWSRSDMLRKLLTERNPPDHNDQYALKAWLVMQLPTLYLYWRMNESQTALKPPSKTVSLYILLFPGEARDNTGTKDLNDNVIGQWWNAQYQQMRYEAIGNIFTAQHGFFVAAQTYKTAFILTHEKSRKHFIKQLALLDETLRRVLLDILKQAAADDSITDNQKAEIKRLTKKLRKGYRFDIFFGLRTLPPQGGSTLANVYLLVTEAMKGAALARFAAKGKTIPSPPVRKVAAQAGVSLDRRGDDRRGKAYDWKVYIRASDLAEKIKQMVLKGTLPGVTVEMNSIYVDTVWTFAYMEYKNLHWGNPDVIRDVRKKKLDRAPFREGNVTSSFRLQRDIMELWLVVLNMLDFVKSFESAEFDNKLKAYHDKALKGFRELDKKPGTNVDWDNLQYVLTHDVRQTDPIAVIGTACEYQFYAKVSDYEQRIFFTMDIRDMGVDLMLIYENSNREVGYHRYSDQDLMRETLRSTDPIDVRRRLTYDIVVATFKKHYDQLAKNPASGFKAAQAVFGGATDGKLGTFDESVQFMLGGDEIYVATHPLFAGVAPAIIGDLDKATFEANRPIDLRTSVAFSRAPKTTFAQQREATQKSHQAALKHNELAPGTLKSLERTNRRIERLINMIEANPQKKVRGAGYRQELAKLPLRILFARWKPNWTKILSKKDNARVYAALQAGDAATIDEYVELVDFTGKVVDRKKLEQDAKTLEDKVRKDVGGDNVQVHAPPIVAIPKWIQALIDKLEPKDPDKKTQ